MSASFDNPLDEANATFDVDTGSPGAGGTHGLDSVLDEQEEESDLVGVRELAKMGMGVGKLGLGIGQLATATALNSLGQMTGTKGVSKLDSAQVKELFDAIDVDGSNEMDRLELRQLVQSMGVQLSEKELNDVMLELCVENRETEAADVIDTADLRVTFEQFEQWWKNNIENANTATATSNFAKLLMGDVDDEAVDAQALCLRATWIDPDRPFKQLWESYIIIILIYIGVTLPYRLAFQATPEGIYYIVAVVYELSLLADVVIGMRTAFEQTTEHGAELVTGTIPMLKTYLFKRMGILDIVASFPFQTARLEQNNNFAGNLKSLQMLRFCQVLRLIKVMRAIKAIQTAFFKVVNETFGSLNASVSLYTLRMIKLLTLLMTVAHLCACGWYYVGQPDAAEIENMELDLGLGLASMENEGWVMRLYPDKKDDKIFLYLHAFYFVQTTMTTVGYGDIGPVRTGEVIFAMLVQAIGCAVFGYVVGLMGTDVSGFDAHEGPVNAKIDFMEALMDKHKINKNVRQRVRRQYNANKTTAQLFLVSEVLSDLPYRLRRDLTLSVFRRAVTTYELVAGFPEDYTSEVARLFAPYQAARGDA
jgi:hypothetical protein